MEYLIDKILSRKKPSKLVSYFHRHPIQAGFTFAIAGLLTALALLIAGAAVHEAITGRSLEQTLGGRGQVLMLVAALLVSGVAAGLLARPARKR